MSRFEPKPGHPKTYEAELGDNQRRSHAHVVVGNENNADACEPHVKASKWDGEAWFSLSLRLPGNIVFQDDERCTNGLIELLSPVLDYRTYVLNDGVMEIDILLKAKPIQGLTLRYDVQKSDNVDFHYQDAPTQQEIDDFGASTPENVIGSYAIYHKTESNFKYRTGKVGHLYSWIAIDANDDHVNLPLQYRTVQ